jgi:hypothetical protein
MLRFLSFIALFLPFVVLAQVEEFTNEFSDISINKNYVYKDHIRSAKMYLFPDPSSAPVLPLNSTNKLILEFDDINMGMDELNYSIQHCDVNWKPSDLDYYRYADGIEEGFLTDYDYSQSMNQKYMTYRLELPNSDVKIRASGNYLLKVYRDGDKKDLILTWRFYVAESRVGINMDIHRAFDPEFRHSKQEVDVVIAHPKMILTNPTQTVKMAILQNWRWDNAKVDLKPNFVGPNELTYNYEEENTFWGGNEQRFIDITNFELKSEFVDGFIKRPDTVHIFTTKEKPRTQHVLLDRRTNLFGKMIFGTSGVASATFDPDYAMVYFYILSEYPETNGDFYVFGELSNWEINPNFKMTYNKEKKRYERPVYLKQGIYNWQYLFVNERSDAGDPRSMEGSFSETLNSYTVLVYYKGVTDDYYRLIGIRTVEYPTFNQE